MPRDPVPRAPKCLGTSDQGTHQEATVALTSHRDCSFESFHEFMTTLARDYGRFEVRNVGVKNLRTIFPSDGAAPSAAR